MAKLQYAWSQIGNEYKNLWNRTYEPDAEAQLNDLFRKEAELSELAATDAPNDQKRLSQWQDKVFQLHHLKSASPENA